MPLGPQNSIAPGTLPSGDDSAKILGTEPVTTTSIVEAAASLSQGIASTDRNESIQSGLIGLIVLVPDPSHTGDNAMASVVPPESPKSEHGYLLGMLIKVLRFLAADPYAEEAIDENRKLHAPTGNTHEPDELDLMEKGKSNLHV